MQARPPIEAEWPLNRGHVIALVLSLVLWAMALAWGWWVIRRLLGILGG